MPVTAVPWPLLSANGSPAVHTPSGPIGTAPAPLEIGLSGLAVGDARGSTLSR